MQQYDIIIIGGGPAGIFAAFQAKLLSLSYLLLESSSKLGGQCSQIYPEKPIYDIPAFVKINGQELTQNLIDQVNYHEKLNYLTNINVSQIAKTENFITIHANNNQSFYAKTVIIATGPGNFDFVKLDINNHDDFLNKNIFYKVNNKDQFQDKHIAIFGGGDSALDWAIELQPIAKSLNIIHRRSKFRAMPESVSQIFKLQENKLINIFTDSKIESFNGEKLVISNFSNNQISEIQSNAILVFFGVIANNHFLTNSPINSSNNNIIVNPITMQTSMENVYAIGNIAHYENKLKLILTGFHEAAVAVRSCYLNTRGKSASLIHSTDLIK